MELVVAAAQLGKHHGGAATTSGGRQWGRTGAMAFGWERGRNRGSTGAVALWQAARVRAAVISERVVRRWRWKIESTR